LRCVEATAEAEDPPRLGEAGQGHEDRPGAQSQALSLGLGLRGRKQEAATVHECFHEVDALDPTSVTLAGWIALRLRGIFSAGDVAQPPCPPSPNRCPRPTPRSARRRCSPVGEPAAAPDTHGPPHATGAGSPTTIGGGDRERFALRESDLHARVRAAGRGDERREDPGRRGRLRTAGTAAPRPPPDAPPGTRSHRTSVRPATRSSLRTCAATATPRSLPAVGTTAPTPSGPWLSTRWR